MNTSVKLYKLDRLQEMEKPDDGFIRHILQVFISHVPESAAALVKACENKDWDNAYFIAHKMKANIDLLEMNAIESEIRTVEHFAKSKIKLEQLPAKASCIYDFICQATAQIKNDFDFK